MLYLLLFLPMIGTPILYKPFVRLGALKQIHYLHLLGKHPYLFGTCIFLVPIKGYPYEEVIPNSTELTGFNDKRERFLPRTCEYMFAAFHHLKEENHGNMGISFNEWIQFWCKKDLKYELAPPRKEKKSRRLSSTHNPTGEIPTEINTWSITQEMVFSKLGAKHQKYETYLVMCLCTSV